MAEFAEDTAGGDEDALFGFAHLGGDVEGYGVFAFLEVGHAVVQADELVGSLE